MKSCRLMFVVLCAVTAASLGGASIAHAAEGKAQEDTPPKWDTETLQLFAGLPIQEGGRVKPLSTYAGFKLLKFRGRRSWVSPARKAEGGFAAFRFRMANPQLGPVEWLLDTIFYPREASEQKIFLVEVSDVLDALKVDVKLRKKRGRYSYQDLLPGREKLFELAQHYASIPVKERTALQNQIVNLADNVADYEQLLGFLDFARQTYPTRATEGLSIIFEEESENRFTSVLRKAPALATMVGALQSEGREDINGRLKEELAAVEQLLGRMDQAGMRAGDLPLLPPTSADPEESGEWLSPGSLIMEAFVGEEFPEKQIALVALLETLLDNRDDPAAFQKTLRALHGDVTAMARQRGEYETIGLEVSFYRYQLFGRALPLYILCFLFIALTWLKPDLRSLNRGGALLLLLPTALLIAGMVMRCVIRSRPPVTTLYETILFTTATCVAIGIFLELMNPRKIAVSTAALLGVAGMFIANKYEIKEGVDTMPSLVAVLDTNFWLASHVTTIVMGYAAALLASAMAHVYLLARLLRLKRNDPPFYAGITRMTYGILCFGLLFSVVGTVLGGIWANESWGRFWGWDPKENGALLLVLWMLFILHARRGNYIADLGINVCAILCGMVVAFSWWGVNLLGVGLHSYGFTSGIFRILLTFYIVEGIVALLGGLIWMSDSRQTASDPS